jgi:hypothetical protein
MSDNVGQVVRQAAYDGVRVSERLHSGRTLLVEFSNSPRFDALFVAARAPVEQPRTAATRELTRELLNTDVASASPIHGM